MLSVPLDSPAVLLASVSIQHFSLLLTWKWPSVVNDNISNCYNTTVDSHIVDKNFSRPVLELLVAPFFWPMYFPDVVGLSHTGAQLSQRPDLSGKARKKPHPFCAHRCVFGFSFPHLCKGIMMCKGPEEKSAHVHCFLPGEIGFEATAWICLVVNLGTELSWKNVELKGETLETRTRLRDEGRDREEVG